MSGPLPTRMVFLSDLPTIAVGEKVRFLGCVQEYAIPTATLLLTHAYPKSDTLVVALLDVSLLLESLRSTDIAVGAWVNVVGYVTGVEKRNPGNGDQSTGPKVRVQAIMVWSAGQLKIGKYEQVLDERLQVERGVG